MLMPALRLLLIYCVLALVVVGVFKRDMISQLILGEPEPVVAVSEPEPEPVAEPVPVPEVAQAEAPASATPAEVASAPEPQPVDPAPAEAAGPGKISGLQTPVADGASAGASAEMPVVRHPEPQAAATTRETVFPTPPAEPTEPPAAVTSEPASEPSVAAAREAYWKGKYKEAEAMLRALIAADPENPDLVGELGNLQYAQRQFPQAAESYAKAAELLVAQGSGAQAQRLVAVLQQIDPAKAAALAKNLAGQ